MSAQECKDVKQDKEMFTPRPYQIDLLEKALKSNAIVYLPTGSGKTYIAVMLIKTLSAAIRKPWSEDGKRTVFAVNTVPLVTQQCSYIARHTDLACKGYSGDMDVDSWNKQKWTDELEENQILVMTAQILLDIVRIGILPLDRINLIIFDECHHAVGDHPMRALMRLFEKYDKDKHPKIFGTSATLLNANVKREKVVSQIRELEVTFHAKIVTVDSIKPVANYGKPNERIIVYEESQSTNISTEINEILNEAVEILKVVDIQSNVTLINESSREFLPQTKSAKIKNVLLDIKEHIEKQGVYFGHKVMLFRIILFEKLKKEINGPSSEAVINYLISKLIYMRCIIDKEMQSETEYEKLLKYSTDKLKKLLSLLKSFKNHDKFCCIIFTRRRFTAKILHHVLSKLKECHEDYKFLNSDFVVGNAASTFQNLQENMCNKKWTAEALLKFRTGIVNCLIATDVLDEGIDVPACSLVIRYDFPQDIRAYIQSKGRCRHEKSNYILFISDKEEQLHKSTYSNYCQVQNLLDQYLIGNTEDRIEPNKNELDSKLYVSNIEPYVVEHSDGTKTILSEVDVISLINRYCSTLVSTKFAILTPTYTLHKVSANGLPAFKVSLKLPLSSPLRETIDSDVMETIMFAQRSAAMKTCIKLHKIGEFTDYLIPKDVTTMVDNVDETWLINWEEETDEKKKKVGTTNNKRSYELIYPKQFYSAFPQINKPSYLHIIEIKPMYIPNFENRNRVYFNLLKDSSTFAILSSKELPELPYFPIYLNVGLLSVSIKVNYSTIELSNDEILKLKRFHTLIFKDVLEMIKSFLVYDSSNKENSFLIVPVDDKYNINWNVIDKYKEVKKEKIINNSIRAITDNTSIITNDFIQQDLQLVTPNYRVSASVYVVTRICHELTPLSPFPTDDYDSYAQYFEKRHAQQIVDNNQNLLEVKPVSTKVKCIRPRGQSKRSNKRKHEDLEEHLIPELCYTITFPALYWIKATTLPSIIHRISQLLIAEDLRLQIALEAGLGTLKNPISSVNEWLLINPTFNDTEDNPNYPNLDDNNLDDSNLECDVTLSKNNHNINNHNNFINNNNINSNDDNPEIDIFSLDSNSYPWMKNREPKDLDRNIEKVERIDIDYYHYFMNSFEVTPYFFKEKINKKMFIKRSSIQSPKLNCLNVINPIGPTAYDIVPALTSKVSNDIINLERLETLGDSFLKYITCCYLFQVYPTGREGMLTSIKGKIIGNRNLYYCGITKNIPGRMKIDEFEPSSNFISPLYCTPHEMQNLVKQHNKSPNVLYEITVPDNEQYDGELTDDTKLKFEEIIINWIDATNSTGVENFIGIQVLPDKTISDCIEALTGVYLKTMGIFNAAKLLQWFGVLPQKISVKDILNNPPLDPKLQDGVDVKSFMPWHSFIENTLGYHFNEPAFLLQAFTHASFTTNNITYSYERLEFLGDAIIDFLITAYIYENCGELSPGTLTDLRSALVNNITFACLTVKYGLHYALLAYAPLLEDSIDKFVQCQEERNHAVNDELLWILLEEDECNFAEYVDVPKILGDLFESVIGAIYLDCKKDLTIVWNILYGLMHQQIEDFSKNIPKQPVRVLYETPGADPKFLKWDTIENKIMVPVQVKVAGKKKIFHGFGVTKKQAKVAASKLALKAIRRNDPKNE